MANLNTILLLLFSCFYSISCGTFYYFAYGSNLLEKRLKINSPSAIYYDVAVLEGYRLDFNMFSPMWNGAVATIVEDPEANVTGVLYLFDQKELPNLDKYDQLHNQFKEGVAVNWYFAKNITVTTLNGTEVEARTYQEVVNPPKRRPCDDLPYERRPSNTYLQVIILGAVQSKVPSDYIGFLVSFPTNGNQANDTIRKKLGYPYDHI